MKFKDSFCVDLSRLTSIVIGTESAVRGYTQKALASFGLGDYCHIRVCEK
jgi:hypothetical protein